jgi:hypothetical protein
LLISQHFFGAPQLSLPNKDYQLAKGAMALSNGMVKLLPEYGASAHCSKRLPIEKNQKIGIPRLECKSYCELFHRSKV